MVPLLAVPRRVRTQAAGTQAGAARGAERTGGGLGCRKGEGRCRRAAAPPESWEVVPAGTTGGRCGLASHGAEEEQDVRPEKWGSEFGEP